MSENMGQEKTEQATPKRLQDSREKGQVAQSRDLNSTVIILCGAIGALVFGQTIVANLSGIANKSFSISREQIFSLDLSISLLSTVISDFILMMLPVFFIFIIASLIGPVVMNGGVINATSLKIKFGKLDPLKGMKKIFAVRGLVELAKTLLKFTLVMSIAILIIWSKFPELLSLGKTTVNQAMGNSMSILSWSFLSMAIGLILIAAIDVPYQLWEHYRQLKMTKQEVKDEHKEMEGKPEVKGHIRNMQHELAKKRMMDEVPKADVIITNPTHYAVAIRYEQEGHTAPRVVAKGKDLMAQQIRKIAKEHHIPHVEAPPLARSIFFTTKLNAEIPHGLFVAVAQVLAYVYQLKRYQQGESVKPKVLSDLPIPDDLYKG